MKLLFFSHICERCLITLLLVLLGIVLTLSGSVNRWDLTLYDLYSTLHYQSPAGKVLVIGIDEASLREYGRWPWSRTVHAALIDKLTRGQAEAIGYDVIFSEASRTQPEDDLDLARAIGQSGRVYLPVFHEQVLERAPLETTFPLPVLTSAAAGLGHIDTELDPDGVARRAALFARFDSTTYPALVLAMLGSSGNEHPLAAIKDRYGAGNVFVSYVGPPGSVASISLADYMHPEFPADAVKDKMVLVGVTALGLGDSLPTPVSGKSVPMPGVEYNANLLNGLLTGSLIVPLAMPWRLLSVAVLAFLSMLLYGLLSPRQSIAVVVGLLLVTLGSSAFFFHYSHVWFPPTAALIVLALSYPLYTWRRLEETILQLFREKERAQVILNSIGDGVIATDVGGNVEYMNPEAELLTGYTLPEARGRHLREVFPVTSEDRQRDLTDIVERCLADQQLVTTQESCFLVNKENREHVVRTSAGMLHNARGSAQGVVLGITDITRIQKMMQQLAYQATHDLLTELPNRSLLFEHIEKIIQSHGPDDALAAVFLIDLDQFKKVNDQVGHYRADRLLKRVGQRLQHCCNPDDLLAHLGSDKFVLVVHNVQDAAGAGRFADRIFEVLEAPFSMDAQDVFISCTIGICLYPGDGLDADEILKNADTALYRAKERGHGMYNFFSRSMDDRIRERLDIEQRLRGALDRQELEVFFQPQVLAANGQLIGAESLLRWNNGENGWVSPGRFVPVAEGCGLILTIGEWVLLTVCRQIKSWQEAGLPRIRVAVNLSPKQFLYGNIFAIVQRGLNETGIDPTCLELEITESLLMDDFSQSSGILTELKKLGVRVSVDDFGTGYSSLSYLKHFPVDQLKIDQSFVKDIVTEPGDAAITQAIVTMAHGLGLGVIAEGVEDEQQLAILREQNCDEIQGYYFSEPLSAEHMTSFLCEYTPS